MGGTHGAGVLQVMGSEAGKDASGDGSADQGRAGGLAERGRLAGRDHIHNVLVAHGDIQDRFAAHRHTAGCLAGAGHTANVLAGAGHTANVLAGAGHRTSVLAGTGHTAGWPAQQSHVGSTTGVSAAQGRATDSRAGQQTGTGHTASRLAAHRAAGVTHVGVRLGGVGTEDRTDLEAPSPGCVLYLGRGVLASRDWVSSLWPPVVFPPPPGKGLFLGLLVAVTQFRKLPQLEADGDPVALGFLKSGQEWAPTW